MFPRTFKLRTLYVETPTRVLWQGKAISPGFAAETAADAANEVVTVLSYKYGTPWYDPLYLSPGAQVLYEADFISLMQTRMSLEIPGSRVRWLAPGDKVVPTQAIMNP